MNFRSLLGGAVAERLQGAGFRVAGVRRSGEPHHAVEHMTTPDRLGIELRKADIVILTCPLTPQTAGLMTSTELASMPTGSSLLNIARAGVADHQSLVAALECGPLSGEILDVYEEEPLPSASPLWDVPNLMIFPMSPQMHLSDTSTAAFGYFRPTWNACSVVHRS